MAPRKGWIYFLQIEGGGAIKIGFTTISPVLRAKTLQTTSPHRICWIGYFKGMEHEEKALHKKFAEHYIRAEWFNPAPEIIAYINEVCPAFNGVDAERKFLRTDVLSDIHSVVPHSKTHVSPKFRACFEQSGDVDWWFFCKWRKHHMLPTPALVKQAEEALTLFQKLNPPPPKASTG